MKSLGAFYMGSARILLMICALLVVVSPIRAEVMINLNTPQNQVNAFKAKLDPVIQGYFKAVVADDKDATLSYYDLTYISTHQMHAAQEAVQTVMRLLNQHIKANGGLRKVDLVGVFHGGSDRVAILQMEFANGVKDISAGIKVKSQGYGNNADWKLAIETGGYPSGIVYPSLAVAGLRSAMKTAEAYYAAMQAGDYAAVRKLTYHDDWLERQPANRQPKKVKTMGDAIVAGIGESTGSRDDYGTPEQRLKRRLSSEIEQMQTLIKANGGIKHIEVSNLGASEGLLGEQYKKGTKDKNYKRLAAMEVRFDVHYSNNKADYNMRKVFILDKGQWKLH